MRYLLLSLFFCFPLFLLNAQSGEAIIAELQSIHQSVTSKRCNTDSAAAVSNRGMNFFLADKTGYLSASSDLSFFTNYVTFNSAEGKLTVNHNFQQKAKTTDEPIKQLLSIGFDVTLAGNYAKSFLDKRFENEIGVTINYKWLGKVKTRFADCAQKNAMDALRASILAQLQQEIIKKETGFKQLLYTMDSSVVPGQDFGQAKKIMQQNFDEALAAEYEEKFAMQQAGLLSKTNNFKLITTHWTSITAYVPLFFPTYTNASNLSAAFAENHAYPASLLLGHTRLWEGTKFGRIFFTLNGAMLFNNSKLSYGLSKMNFSEYKSLGGSGTQPTNDPGNNKLYIGTYKNFVSPSLSARLVYFPSNSHIGISLLAEKSFGDYDRINCKAAIPVVLINRKKTPAAVIECYVLFLDIAHTMTGISRTAIGVSLGIPFSRLMY